MAALRCARVLLAGLALAVLWAPAATAGSPYEPFVAQSYWRTPSANPPDARSAAMIHWLATVLGPSRRFVTIRATGMNGSSAQGTSVYYASGTAPRYAICHNPNYRRYTFPPEAADVRIPRGARAPRDVDGDMIVYNLFDHRVFFFTNMRRLGGRWCASQLSVYYTGSNGLIGALPQSTNRRNWGKHGLAPITQAVRWSEVATGIVPHVMDIYLPMVSCNMDDRYPLSTGTYCTTRAAGSIPAGAVLRIRPSVNLAALHLRPAALVIARALQRDGAIVGDHSGAGNNATIKLEDTAVEGKGNLWLGAGLRFDSLKAIPLWAYQIDRLGAGR